MTKHRLLLALGGFIATLGTVLTLTTGSALAATKTWDGGGGDNKLATPTNWNDDLTPATGDSLVFPTGVIMGACSGDVTLTNDIDPNTVTLGGITYSGTDSCTSARHTLSISGGELKLSGNITGSGTTYQNATLPSIDSDITLTADIAITVKGLVIGSNKTVALGAHALTAGGSSDSTTINGLLTGSGTFIVEGYTALTGDSAGYSGNIVVNHGTLYVAYASNDHGLGDATGTTTINSSGVLSMQHAISGNSNSYSEPLVFNGGTVLVYKNSSGFDVKDVTWTGPVSFMADTSFQLQEVNLKLTGTVTGADHIKVQDGYTGLVTLPDGTKLESALKTTTINDTLSCYTDDYGYYITPNNRYIWDISCPGLGGKTGPTGTGSDVYDGQIFGILAGSGVLGSVKIMNGGVIAPGHSPGTITVGNLTFDTGGSYELEIKSATAGDYDQVIVPGTVTLGGGTLNTILLSGFSLNAGQKLTIINNTGGSPVNGAFKDLPEGTAFTVSGVTFRISYAGGDGNDVVLTVVSVPGTPKTGVALLQNNPIAVLSISTACAGAILFIARRYGFVKL